MVVIRLMKSPVLILCALAALTAVSCSKPKPKVAPLNEVAPPVFRVNVDTTRGPVIIEVTRANAPLGADRFYSLVKSKFFDGARFFRVVPGFIVQFGMNADPKVHAAWDAPIKDDPMVDTRTSQLFINLGENQRLDNRPEHFAPIGKVVSGMDYVDRIYAGDGEKPQQNRIESEGNAYLEKDFPHLDYIRTARLAE